MKFIHMGTFKNTMQNHIVTFSGDIFHINDIIRKSPAEGQNTLYIRLIISICPDFIFSDPFLLNKYTSHEKLLVVFRFFNICQLHGYEDFDFLLFLHSEGDV